ncbi:MAG: HdaA/DnaA family protein [Dongiaceae bacterium]
MSAGARPLTQLPFEFGHRPSYAAADFLISDSNADAYGWVERWPDWPAPGLVVHGPPGCGKSHLAELWGARADAVAIATAMLETRDAAALLGEARCCIVDDLTDCLEGNGAERTLLHLFNMVAERHGQMMLSASTPPVRWRIGLADLRSRLLAIPSVAIKPPDDGLLQALISKLFHDRQMSVDSDVVSYIVTRMERSFDGARRIVDAIDRAALAQRRRPTGTLVRDVMDRLRRESAED